MQIGVKLAEFFFLLFFLFSHVTTATPFSPHVAPREATENVNVLLDASVTFILIGVFLLWFFFFFSCSTTH